MKYVLVVLTIFVSACSKTSSSSSASVKGLFSEWAADDGSFNLDFSGGTFNQAYSSYFYIPSNDEFCLCQSLTFSGTESAGAISISGCSHFAGNTDSGLCSAFENGGVAFTFTKSSDSLNICDASGCTIFH